MARLQYRAETNWPNIIYPFYGPLYCLEVQVVPNKEIPSEFDVRHKKKEIKLKTLFGLLGCFEVYRCSRADAFEVKEAGREAGV